MFPQSTPIIEEEEEEDNEREEEDIDATTWHDNSIAELLLFELHNGSWMEWE